MARFVRKATGKAEPPIPRHSQEYTEYLNSPAWLARRQEAIEAATGRCQRCGASGDGITLQAHHLSYERLGSERPEDLKVVCVPCHEVEDAERRARQARIAWRKRVDGWADRRYGEGWEDRLDYEHVRDEFRDWLDRRSGDH
jgi:5-methylcytosine-specific restriction endonuclease McrA